MGVSDSEHVCYPLLTFGGWGVGKNLELLCGRRPMTMSCESIVGSADRPVVGVPLLWWWGVSFIAVG